jgi:alpha-ribazole phosphatase/probable phosphoglycerate mutase
MKITLVRHGEVDGAYHKCYNGHIDIPLSKQGEEEAKALALHFKDRSFDAIFCSDLKRCRQTLEAFELQVRPVYTSALREKSWGRHEGKSFDEIISNEDFVYENFEQWINALDGEEYAEYIKRIENFFKGFLLANPYKEVLVMTHAGVIRVLMHVLQDISLEEAFSKSFAYANHICLDTDTWTFTQKNKDDLQCV